MYSNAPRLGSISGGSHIALPSFWDGGNDGKTKPSGAKGFAARRDFMALSPIASTPTAPCYILMVGGIRVYTENPSDHTSRWIIQKYPQLNFSLSIKIVEWIFRFDGKETERKIYVGSVLLYILAPCCGGRSSSVVLPTHDCSISPFPYFKLSSRKPLQPAWTW